MKATKFAAVIGTKGRITIPKINLEILAKKMGYPSLSSAVITLEIKTIQFPGSNIYETQALIRD